MRIFEAPETVSHQDIYNRISVLETKNDAIAKTLVANGKAIDAIAKGVASLNIVSGIAKFSVGTIAIVLPMGVVSTFWLYSQITTLNIQVQDFKQASSVVRRLVEEFRVLDELELRTREPQHFVDPKRFPTDKIYGNPRNH